MNEPETSPKTWSVGELAASCRVTVRTLHHYDQVGLVIASARTSAGHRRYSVGDVRRLYMVLALRQLGLRLDEIAKWLDADSDLVALVRRQLDAADREVRRHQQLRDRLARIVNALERTGRTTADDFIGAMQEMAMYDDHLTPEQQTRLEHDRSQLGYSGIDPWRTDAEEAVSALRTTYEEGLDPADPRVQDLVQRIRQLKRQFTGDDPEICVALRQVHADRSWDAIRALVPQDPQLRAFWKQARDAMNA